MGLLKLFHFPWPNGSGFSQPSNIIDNEACLHSFEKFHRVIKKFLEKEYYEFVFKIFMSASEARVFLLEIFSKNTF